MKIETDFVVIGSGIAGLRAAIGLSESGARVVVLTKDRLGESNTEYAQGGVAVVLSDDDQVALHRQDTLVAGAGLCDESVVRVLVEEGPKYIMELIDWGTQFDREGGKLVFTKEAAHSRRRILHAQGDSTGREIVRALLARARQAKNISLQAHATTLDIVMRDGRAVGVSFLDDKHQVCHLFARAVILATGGAGQLYQHTTNPDVATGDGMGMAYRAGARMCDMEFVQFHPTALNIPEAPRFLLSEAMRGEGAYLINEQGQRFMPDYDSRAELAPRDIVSRAIISEMKRTGSPRVYLDITHREASYVRDRFPKIYLTCLQYNYDITKDRIPVSPAAHYIMGGVRTDDEGLTSIPGLYAAGEVASTGVHGANRLASNSLLEGLVFGARAAEAALRDARALTVADTVEPDPGAYTGELRLSREVKQRVGEVMWRYVGITRDEGGLNQAISELETMAAAALNLVTNNFVTVAQLIAAAARFRLESRGGHYREDFPVTDDERWRCHTIQQLGRDITTMPLT